MNRTYTQTFLFIWALLGLLYVLVGSHAVMHAVQGHRMVWLDQLVLVWTKAGEAQAATLLSVLLWWMHRHRDTWKPVRKAFAISILLAVLIPQGLKFLFLDFPRPWTVFPNVQEIPGLTKSFYKSFPSGHTAFATALTAAWARLALPKFQFPILMVVGAVGVGYSRIYLHMHWLHDVLAGGIIGLGCAYLGLRWSGILETH